MAKEIIMPKMGNTVESVIMGEINIKVGDNISNGDILFDYETDKSTSEYTSEVEGQVLAVLVQPGEEVPVLKTIIIVGKEGEDISAYTSLTKEKTTETSTQTIKEVPKSAEKEPVINNFSTEKKFFSPRAIKIAKELNLDLNLIKYGTGVNGRINEEDVLTYYHHFEKGNEKNSNAIEFNHIEYTGVRKAIANSLTNSIQSGAQLTLGATFDATALLKLRSQIKNNFERLEISNSSINDLIVFALAKTLPKFPHINSIIGPDYYDAYNVAHISIAVDTPNGLFVPVIKNASNLSLSEITNVSKELIAKAKSGKLSPKDQSGGTFTISNLGLSGVSFFTPILNPPQAALLGVGSPQKRLRLNSSGNVEEYVEIMLSLTMDHRPFDGATGAKFIKEFVSVLEDIHLLLL